MEERDFARRLLDWYDANGRVLPWREDQDPYRVWLSEIMLQQTRVAAVLEHYAEFLRRFPSPEKLASATEESVLSAWSGLGYYRRARMLHAAAKQVVEQHQGQLPRTAKQLESLSGIGRYTAAAVASIAFGEPVAVVDGNVERVLQRCLGRLLSKNDAWRLANERLSRERPGDFNQAMMELGATVCIPGKPKCLICPVEGFCKTKGTGIRKSQADRQTKKEIHYALSLRKEAVFLRQRPTFASLMPGMWELPEMGEHDNSEILFTLKHSITVTNYTVRVHKRPRSSAAGGQWVPKQRLHETALTGLARKILRKAEVLGQGIKVGIDESAS